MVCLLTDSHARCISSGKYTKKHTWGEIIESNKQILKLKFVHVWTVYGGYVVNRYKYVTMVISSYAYLTMIQPCYLIKNIGDIEPILLFVIFFPQYMYKMPLIKPYL